jgi:hypothetical protein
MLFRFFSWWYAISPFVTFSSYLGSMEVTTLEVLTHENEQLTFKHSNDLSKVKKKNTALFITPKN